MRHTLACCCCHATHPGLLPLLLPLLLLPQLHDAALNHARWCNYGYTVEQEGDRWAAAAAGLGPGARVGIGVGVGVGVGVEVGVGVGVEVGVGWSHHITGEG